MSSALLPRLPAQEADKIIALMGQYAADTRPGKVDLGVGVYRDAEGRTPVMGAIKAAEARLLEQQDSKGYLPMAGDAGFHRALGDLVLGPRPPWERVAALATPGGTGALRQALELARRANPGLTVWIPEQTWPNHPGMAQAMGLAMRFYRYHDPDANALDRAGLWADLEQMAPGDVVILHACCHNPSGADLTLQDWDDMADLLARRGALPLVDVAYQGFGVDLDTDMAGLRLLLDRLPEVLVAVSGSKTFGMYRDRVGLLLALCPDTRTQSVVAGQLTYLNRLNYGFPPDHGARAVTEVLTDPDLRHQWETELAAMRDRIAQMRRMLADALRAETGSDRFGFLAQQSGMFSLMGADDRQVADLRDGHGIYMVGGGRINVGGLNSGNIPPVARAIAQVMG